MMKQLLYGLTFVMFAAMAVAACTELTASDDVSALVLDPVYSETVSVAGTQMSTMTVLQATAESAHIMATQIGELTVQNQNLQATISAMSVVNTGQQPPAAQPQVEVANAASPQTQGQVNPAGGSQPTDPNLAAQTVANINASGQVVPTSTPHLIEPAPAVNKFDDTVQTSQTGEFTSANGTTYTGATTAFAVNDTDGCAADTTSSFDPETSEIYMTIVARNVLQGAVFNVQWLWEGEFSFTSSDTGWAADQDYDEICIWFSAVGPFDSGNWTAEFTENGEVVGSHDFFITGDNGMVEDTMDIEPTSES